MKLYKLSQSSIKIKEFKISEPQTLHKPILPYNPTPRRKKNTNLLMNPSNNSSLFSSFQCLVRVKNSGGERAWDNATEFIREKEI